MTNSVVKLFGVVGLAVGGWVVAADPPATPPPAPPGSTPPAAPVVGTPKTGDASGEKSSASPLEGDYTITAGEEGGAAVPKERFKGAIVRFRGDKVTGTTQDMREFFGATYVLDRDKTPWTIKLTTTTPKAGAVADGLVKVDGPEITLIYALPGGAAPTEFKTKANQNLFVLRGMSAPLRTTPNKFTNDSGDPPATPKLPVSPDRPVK